MSLTYLSRIRRYRRSASCCEIVVSIFKDGNGVGELDIDSHALTAFSEDDTAFLEEVSKAVGSLL